MKRRTLLHPLLHAGVLLASAFLARPGSAADGSLLTRLRAGGLVIFFRHSLTQRTGQPDDDLSSCERQRNLTEPGRALALDIGAAFRELGIPVAAVRASPYCRCVDTARLAFGRVEVAAFLETNGNIADPAEQGRVAGLAAALQSAPPAGANTVFVAHGNNLGGLSSLHDYPVLRIDEAEAVVFAPRQRAPAEVLGRVTGGGWRALG